MDNPMRKEYEHVFINNEWVANSSGQSIDVVNPATEEVIGRAPLAGIAECELAIAAARAAYNEGSWRRMGFADRAVVLNRYLDVILARAMDITSIIVEESGHSFGITFSICVKAAIDICRRQLEISREGFDQYTPVVTAPNPLDGYKTTNAQASVVVRKPLGVVAAIVPFNACFMLSLVKSIPALAMGNTVVLKVSEQTPLEGLLLGDLALEADLPAGLLNIITGKPEVGNCLTAHTDVDVVSFTGSDAVGSAIMAQGAPSLKRLLLELGGKSASVVLKDANLKDAAMFGAGNSVAMAGQGCALSTRHIVHNSVIDEYVAKLSRMLWAMPIGNPMVPYTQMGPLISAKQRDRVEQFVALAREEGGEVVTGGRRPSHLEKGFFYEPTIITGLSNSSRVCQEEIFGPVIAVIGFDSEEEAISIANDSQYGLSGAIFSQDRGKAFHLGQQIETGYININPTAVSPDLNAPFGGIKRSGFGREWGEEGLKEFSYQQTLTYPIG